MYYIGIDLGGMSVKAGLVDEEGRIVRKATCPTLVERGARPIVDDMARLCLDLIRDEGTSEDDVKAIGVGLPGIDEAAVLRDAVCELQSVVDLPLQIDTASPAAMEAAAVSGSIRPAHTTGISQNCRMCSTSSRLQFSGM